jgi:hypothetical protein
VTEERRQRILEVAAELEAQGQVATNSAVYSLVMGHRGHVVQVLKERRAQARASGVAVAEDDEEEETAEIPAATLTEDLRQLEAAYDAWHLALERLWAIEQEGPLSEAHLSRKTWLEYQMVQNIQTQERLRPQLERAQIREALHAAQAQHDAGIPRARTLAEQALQAVATLHDLFEDLAEVFQAQVEAFFPFRTPRGLQAFDVLSGHDYALQLLSAFFPNDPRAREAFLLLVDTKLTMGMLRQALDACPRLMPFSPTAITSYLNTMTEGTSNGSHP